MVRSTKILMLCIVVALVAAFGAARAPVRHVLARLGSVGASLREFSHPMAVVKRWTDLPRKPRVIPSLTREAVVARELALRSRSLSASAAQRTAKALCAEAQRLGYDPLMFLAVIHVESSYNHKAVSPVGAVGLMQLMPSTAAGLAKYLRMDWRAELAMEPVVNVRLGVRYLVQLRKSFHSWDLALTAYNRGAGATRKIVRESGGLPENIRDSYATKVLRKYTALKKRYGHLPVSAS
jgi:soluble lytic murein transglycosylase-like protein